MYACIYIYIYIYIYSGLGRVQEALQQGGGLRVPGGLSGGIRPVVISYLLVILIHMLVFISYTSIYFNGLYILVILSSDNRNSKSNNK